MARHAVVLFASLLAAAGMVFLVPAAEGEPPEVVLDRGAGGAARAAGELIVVYEDASGAVPESGLRSLAGGRSAEVEEIPELDAQVVAFPAIKAEASGEERRTALARVKDRLEDEPGVQDVYYNHLRTASFTPNDSGFGGQWGIKRAGFPGAWESVRGRGVKVGVVDSGASLHPDLSRKVARRWDFRNGNTTVEDPFGHGTHIAGIVGARTNNRAGVAGGCPRCRLFIAKVLDYRGVGYDSDIAKGVMWSAKHGAKVVNLSLGGPGEKSVLKNAIDYATRRGAVVVAAAGNRGVGDLEYPAAYRNVIAVSATDPYDQRPSFSNYGYYVDVAAPGTEILSTGKDGDYERWSGTSMSTAHVSALAGLLAGQRRGPLKIRNRVILTASDVGPRGRDPYYGTGIINAKKAVRR